MTGSPYDTQHQNNAHPKTKGPIPGFGPANERRRYFVTTSLFGWAQD